MKNTYTYWNHSGEYQDLYEEMIDANFDMKLSNKYHRYYNDGDMPYGFANYFYGTEIVEDYLEANASLEILKAYKRYMKETKKTDCEYFELCTIDDVINATKITVESYK